MEFRTKHNKWWIDVGCNFRQFLFGMWYMYEYNELFVMIYLSFFTITIWKKRLKTEVYDD